MKHFDISQWADFARGVSEDVNRSAMEAHLASGCGRCQRIVEVLRGVAVAAGKAGYEPSDDVIRLAKAIFPVHARQKVLSPRLVFDSFRQPLTAGMRSQDRLARHALYETGSFSLDLQVEREPDGGLITMIGQLSDRGTPEASTANVPVLLMARENLVASTICNRFGEFQLQYKSAPHLRLSVPLPSAETRLELPLNRLTVEPSARLRATSLVRRRVRPKPGGTT
jgi:hypothetical protein